MDFEEYSEQEETQERNVYLRILQGVVAFVVLIGFVYISGVYQHFLYSRTPSAVQQETIKQQAVYEEIAVPISIHILHNNEQNGSSRTTEDAQRIVRNANEIWEQAGISTEIQNIQMMKLSDRDIESLLDFPARFSSFTDSSAINVLFVENLRGSNGISYGGLRTVAVADYTTVYDFRVLAHEVGHVLGLSHIPGDKARLMFQGANGVILSKEEIETARTRARNF
jgi:predicted Zn-dependent protease